jgi:hypothetical protein
MKKIDLIIDALDVSESLFYDQTKLQEALQAARELKALEPVAWITKGGEGELWWYQSVDENGDNNPKDVALYALDEVTK